MTYFGFLGIFVFLPIVLLGLLTLFDHRRGKNLPDALHAWPIGLALVVHMAVAFFYTTPWDNYLVATGVWFYNPDLVTGIVFGWVPLEEYTFFLLQPVLTGLWLFTLWRYLPLPETAPVMSRGLRLGLLASVLVMWIVAAVILLVGWQPGTYLGLELIWALPPILLQLAFGADLLWRYRRHVFLTIATSTLYLAFADTIAIGAGTWTIDPAQSLPIYLGGILPVEEFVFFMVTNVLLVFGVTLVMAKESHERVPNAMRRYLPSRAPKPAAQTDRFEVSQ